jgi:hypothetical protein
LCYNFRPSNLILHTRCRVCYCVCISRGSSTTRIIISMMRKNSTNCSPAHACHKIARSRSFSLAESYNNIGRNTHCTSHLDSSPTRAFSAA